MTSTGLSAMRTAALAFIIVAILVLAGCAPSVQLTSPVGVWEASGEDNGTLTINTDGTFTINDASFNLVQKRDADDNFNGSGTWRTFPDDPELILYFDEASQGDFNVEPAGRRADFASGTLRYFHPEQTASIEFRLTETESSP
ncbi:MAG: hypothetical protein ACTH8F_13370 [Microbacterium sp.]|uniref:hypothetical protein n=1 Tax=Microbacterium sp. TaxID=51671 RepID=UPI003F95DD2C